MILSATATKAPGKTFSFLSAGTLSQAMSIISEITDIIMAPVTKTFLSPTNQIIF